MNKKLISLTVLCIFMLGLVPAGFAEESAADDSTPKVIAKNQIKTQDRQKVVIKAEAKELKQANKFNELKTALSKEVSAKIKEFKQEDFRQYQRDRLMNAVDKCKELGKDSALCQKKLETRTQLISKLQEKDIARVQKIAEHKATVINKVAELVKEKAFKNYDLDKNFKAREVVKNKLEKAKAAFDKAKDLLTKAKEKFSTAKDKLKDVKEQRERCKEEQNCAQVEANVRLHAKEMLIKTSEQVKNAFDKLLSRVQSAESLTDAEETKYTEQINAELAKITAFEPRISALNENSTKEEVNALFKELKDAVSASKEAIKKINSMLTLSNMGGIIVKSKHLQIKLDRVLEKMAEKGKDTAAIQPMIDEFNTKIDDAKTQFELAKAEFEKTDSKAAGHEYMVKARAALNDAQKVLQKILRTIAAQKGSEELAEVEADKAEAVIDNAAIAAETVSTVGEVS